MEQRSGIWQKRHIYRVVVQNPSWSHDFNYLEFTCPEIKCPGLENWNLGDPSPPHPLFFFLPLFPLSYFFFSLSLSLAQPLTLSTCLRLFLMSCYFCQDKCAAAVPLAVASQRHVGTDTIYITGWHTRWSHVTFIFGFHLCHATSGCLLLSLQQ